MTLNDLSLPVGLEWAKQYALVFDASLAARLAQVQLSYGDARHVPNAVALTDGRYMLNADILTECVPGGLVYGGFSHLDRSRFDEIDVLPKEHVLTLLPEPAPTP